MPEKPTPTTTSEYFREELKALEEQAKDFISDLRLLKNEPGFNVTECVEQAILALRHLEDARMRFGKVIQYAEGGVSKYDKPQPTQA